jgi:hypothetical protein
MDGPAMMGDGPGSGPGSDCENLVPAANIATGHHNAGMGCMNAAACHNMALGLGVNAPAYSYAGTVYKNATDTLGYAGATILVTLNGTTTKLISDTLGNFYTTPDLLAAPTTAMPGMTAATVCPAKTAMSGSLVNAGGNCNAGGTCHGGTQGKIHIP